jgi:hypothetical protein
VADQAGVGKKSRRRSRRGSVGGCRCAVFAPSQHQSESKSGDDQKWAQHGGAKHNARRQEAEEPIRE